MRVVLGDRDIARGPGRPGNSTGRSGVGLLGVQLLGRPLLLLHVEGAAACRHRRRGMHPPVWMHACMHDAR